MNALLNLDDLDDFLKESLVKDTWCDNCRAADLGIIEPELYQESGKTFISGKCTKCGSICTSEIISKEIIG